MDGRIGFHAGQCNRSTVDRFIIVNGVSTAPLGAFLRAQLQVKNLQKDVKNYLRLRAGGLRGRLRMPNSLAWAAK